jgi:hypothetical protein
MMSFLKVKKLFRERMTRNELPVWIPEAAQ